MIYIYDILLNLNEELIEFFEWQDEDNIKYIKRIPIYKVNDDLIYEIINNKIVVDNNFLKQIEYKTDFCDNTYVFDYKYLTLLTNKKIIIGIRFNEQGIQEEISRLLIDEEHEILVLSERLKVQEINYQIMKKNTKNNLYLTRNEEKIKKSFEEEINELYKNNNLDKLNYLYYEYFNNTCNDKNIVYKSLLESVKNFNDKHILLYDIMKMSKSL